MSDTIPNFDKQELKLSNENWKVELFLERGNSENEDFVYCDKTIELSEPGKWTSNFMVTRTNLRKHRRKHSIFTFQRWSVLKIQQRRNIKFFH